MTGDRARDGERERERHRERDRERERDRDRARDGERERETFHVVGGVGRSNDVVMSRCETNLT